MLPTVLTLAVDNDFLKVGFVRELSTIPLDYRQQKDSGRIFEDF